MVVMQTRRLRVPVIMPRMKSPGESYEKQTEATRMVEVKNLLESDYVTIDFVKASPSKRAVIISPGVIGPNQQGNNKLTMQVEIDGKNKKWSPNRKTLENVSKAWGTNTDKWVGKVVTFQMALASNGKEIVLGLPTITTQLPVEEIPEVAN
jgi:hypothetical protein